MERVNFCGEADSITKAAYLRNNSSKNETTGSVGAKTSNTEMQETTGSIGIKTLNRDTVSFKGKDGDDSSLLSKLSFAGFSTLAAIFILGYAKKINVVDKIPNPKVRNFIKNYDVISEPCYKLCKLIKNYSARGINSVKSIIK